MPIPPLEQKLLNNQITTVAAHQRTDGKLGLVVTIEVGAAPVPFYSELKIQAFDEKGAVIAVKPVAPGATPIASIGGSCLGHYVVEKTPDQQVTAIEITRLGNTERFPVQIIPAVKRPPVIKPPIRE